MFTDKHRTHIQTQMIIHNLPAEVISYAAYLDYFYVKVATSRHDKIADIIIRLRKGLV